MATTVLPDDLWKRLEPLLPKPKENRHVQFAGRKPTDLRRIVTGILFVLRTGIPWRSLPATKGLPSGQPAGAIFDNGTNWESGNASGVARGTTGNTPDRLGSRSVILVRA